MTQYEINYRNSPSGKAARHRADIKFYRRHRQKCVQKSRDYRKAHPEKGIAIRERNKAIIRDAKKKPCADCGQSYPFYVMDFDHQKDKLFNIGKASCCSVETLQREIAKCDVVCANCHRIRTFAIISLQRV